MTVKISEGGLWSGTVTFLTPETAYLSFSLPEVYLTHLGEPKRSSCVKFPLPGKRWTCPQELPQQFPTPFTGQGGQPAQCLLIYLLLHFGIWISFAQANPTWQWWPNPNETHTANCSSAECRHLLQLGVYVSPMYVKTYRLYQQLCFVHLQLGNIHWDLKPDYKKRLRRTNLPDVTFHSFLNVGSWSLISEWRAVVHLWAALPNVFSLQTVPGKVLVQDKLISSWLLCQSV